MSPSGTQITSFAQSVLALHKLQDGAGANFEKPVSKRKISHLESGIGLPGVYGYKVRVGNHYPCFHQYSINIINIGAHLGYNIPMIVIFLQDVPSWSVGSTNLRPLHCSSPNTGNTSSMLSLHKINSPPQQLSSNKRCSRPHSGIPEPSAVTSTVSKLFNSKDCLP